MEKRRVRLEINGVVCGLITQESEEYMQSLADEVGEMMRAILAASPFVTREAAALTAALSYCDDAKKNGQSVSALQERVDELEVEAELWQEEKAALEAGGAGQDPAAAEKLRKLEAENTALAEAAERAKKLQEQADSLRDENEALRQEARKALEELREAKLAAERAPEVKKEPELPVQRVQAQPAVERPAKRRKNPLRYEEDFEQEGFVSFFEKK